MKARKSGGRALVRRLAAKFRHHPDLQPVIGPALALALLNRVAVRSVNHLARLLGMKTRTLERQYVTSALAACGISLEELPSGFLLVRVAELPVAGRNWTGAGIALGVGEKRLRDARTFWLGPGHSEARALELGEVIAAIQTGLGLH